MWQLNQSCSPSLANPSRMALHANIEDSVRLDVVVDGFLGAKRQRTFLDVRIFNPLTPSNRESSLLTTYNSHEKEKRRTYNQRVSEIESGTFSPLIFSLTGGMGKEYTVFYKRLASLLSTKWDEPYSVSLVFSLLQSSIQCLRGARSTQGHAVRTSPYSINRK